MDCLDNCEKKFSSSIYFHFYILANQDPVSSMLGERFATVEGKDSAPLRYMEEIMRAKPKGRILKGSDLKRLDLLFTKLSGYQ